MFGGGAPEWRVGASRASCTPCPCVVSMGRSVPGGLSSWVWAPTCSSVLQSSLGLAGKVVCLYPAVLEGKYKEPGLMRPTAGERENSRVWRQGVALLSGPGLGLLPLTSPVIGGLRHDSGLPPALSALCLLPKWTLVPTWAAAWLQPPRGGGVTLARLWPLPCEQAPLF